jgi:hypothetical protein
MDLKTILEHVEGVGLVSLLFNEDRDTVINLEIGFARLLAEICG